LVETTLAFLGERLERNAIVPELHLGDVPSVHGDSERLQQVLLNLFMNATDAMADGGTLRVDLAQDENGEIELKVADTGVGIDEADQRRIFDPFVTTKTASEGHGLGLAVAHGIISEHGGAIELSRSDRTGTVFRIVLPASPR